MKTSPTIYTSIVLVDSKKNEYPINVTAKRSAIDSVETNNIQWFTVQFGLPMAYLIASVHRDNIIDAIQRVADEFSTRNRFAVDPHPDSVKKLQLMLV